MTTKEIVQWAYDVLEGASDDLMWVMEKWEPAAAVSLGNQEWLFFGWASS
jgi:hypothetical protein